MIFQLINEQKTETPIEQPRCMMASTEHYKCPQTVKHGRVKAPMSQLDTPRVLSNFKVDDTQRRSTEIVEEQSYITNIIPDAEIQTSETEYNDWLAAHGLLELQSSPGKDNILEAKYRERKAALNNLHWSLNAIYKFIDVNEFTQIEHQEIENKLQEILNSLKPKLVHEDPLIYKIEERGKDKKNSVRKEEQAETKDDGNHKISVICKTKENNMDKLENKESEKKEDNGMKTEGTDVVKVENKESEKKEDKVVKMEMTKSSIKDEKKLNYKVPLVLV